MTAMDATVLKPGLAADFACARQWGTGSQLDGSVAKPFSPRRLLATINQFLP